MTKYIVELGINIFGQGVKWTRSSDLPAVYESIEEAQRAINSHASGCVYRVGVLEDELSQKLLSKLKRIQAVLDSKSKVEQIQNILSEE